jgi:hypothetical protein
MRVYDAGRGYIRPLCRVIALFLLAFFPRKSLRRVWDF